MSNNKYICNSSLATWKVIEIFDTEVPDDVLKALEEEQKNKEGAIYSLMWEDALLYHGEDGYVLSDETLDICESWLEDHRREHGLDPRACFWFRVKRS